MRAIELTAAIDEAGRLQAQLPKDVSAQQVRVLVLLEDDGQQAATGEGELSFGAVAIDTAGFRFDRDRAGER